MRKKDLLRTPLPSPSSQHQQWKVGNGHKKNYSFKLKLKHYNIKRAKKIEGKCIKKIK